MARPKRNPGYNRYPSWSQNRELRHSRLSECALQSFPLRPEPVIICRAISRSFEGYCVSSVRRIRSLSVVVVPCRASVLCPSACSCGLPIFHERAPTRTSSRTFVDPAVSGCLAILGVRSGKSLGLPSDKSLLASKCLQYGANYISTVYFKSFVGMLGLEVQHWHVKTLPAWVFNCMHQAYPSLWSRYLRVCHTGASTGLPPCTPLDNFLFPSTTWQRELVANNPLPSTDDHSAAQWFDELRFQVWLPRFIRRRCENHFMMSYPHLTAPTELAILLEAPLTECLSSTEPQVLSIAGLDGYPGL